MPFNRLIIILIGLLGAAPVFAEPISVTDYEGRTVSLTKPANRVIALAPHVVENVFSAGAGDLLVGTVDYSDYPEAAKSIPRIGTIQGVSAEAIVALQPDLVLAWSSGHSSGIAQHLIELGLTVYFDEPKTLPDVAKSMVDIGLLTGRVTQAQRAADQYLAKLSQLQAQYAEREEVTMLYQVWNKPLRTINGKHIISDVMSLCGGRNIFDDAIAIAPKISIESVLERDPQAIVASGMGDQRPDWLDDWLTWESLTAVKTRQLFFVPPDLIQRHTARILDGATILCRQLDSVRHGNPLVDE